MNYKVNMKTRTRSTPIPLIIEPHPEDYEGYPFITLIQYRKQHVLTLIDNTDDKQIHHYLLDLCGPESVDEEQIIGVATEWWEDSRAKYPISIEFSKRGMTKDVSQIYRTYSKEFVTRVIGPLPRFEMSETISIKRRKRKPVPQGIQVIHTHTDIFEDYFLGLKEG